MLSADERSDRSLRARIAAHERWAQCDDPTAATARARAKFLKRFEDPNVTDPVERARRAEHARRAYFARLALASARARRKSAS